MLSGRKQSVPILSADKKSQRFIHDDHPHEAAISDPRAMPQVTDLLAKLGSFPLRSSEPSATEQAQQTPHRHHPLNHS